MSTDLKKAVRYLIETSAGARVDNWEDMRLPSITEKQAYLLELGPLLEDFSIDPASMGLEDLDDGLYGVFRRGAHRPAFSGGDVGGFRMEELEEDEAKALTEADGEDLFEALRELWIDQ